MAAGRGFPKLRIDIRIEAGDWPPPRQLRTLVERVLLAAATNGIGVPAEAEVSLLFTDDVHMSSLNAEWRRVQQSTNVLSFPALKVLPETPGLQPFLGDVVLAFETIHRESAQQGLKFDDHLTHLVLHGFLHLLGFDHVKNDEADRMEGLETAILGGLGIKDPHSTSGKHSARLRRR